MLFSRDLYWLISVATVQRGREITLLININIIHSQRAQAWRTGTVLRAQIILARWAHILLTRFPRVTDQMQDLTVVPVEIFIEMATIPIPEIHIRVLEVPGTRMLPRRKDLTIKMATIIPLRGWVICLLNVLLPTVCMECHIMFNRFLRMKDQVVTFDQVQTTITHIIQTDNWQGWRKIERLQLSSPLQPLTPQISNRTITLNRLGAETTITLNHRFILGCDECSTAKVCWFFYSHSRWI